MHGHPGTPAVARRDGLNLEPRQDNTTSDDDYGEKLGQGQYVTVSSSVTEIPVMQNGTVMVSEDDYGLVRLCANAKDSFD